MGYGVGDLFRASGLSDGIVDGVAEVFQHQLGCIAIQLDQKISTRIKGDEALGQALIDGIDCRGGGCRCFRCFGHGFNLQSQGRRYRLKRKVRIDRLNFLLHQRILQLLLYQDCNL